MPITERYSKLLSLTDSHYMDWLAENQYYEKDMLQPANLPTSDEEKFEVWALQYPIDPIAAHSKRKYATPSNLRSQYVIDAAKPIKMYGGGKIDIDPTVYDIRSFYNMAPSFRISSRAVRDESPALFMSGSAVKSEIEKVIEEALYIKSLPDNWDEEGAQKISEEIFTSTAAFLRYCSNYLYIGAGIILPAPEINPCKDGSIDLSWRTGTARLLINIRMQEGALYAFFYGDRYNNKMPIKGNFPLSEFSESLAAWMKYLV